MIILACATERECQRALARFVPRHIDSWPLIIQAEGHDILAQVVGIGPVAAALTVGALLERYPQTTGIVNLGICGTFDAENYPMGCPCVADAEIWPEYGLRCVGSSPEELFSHQMLPELTLFPANHLDLTPTLAAEAMGLLLPDSWPTGHSMTVGGVSGDMERARMLQLQFNAATENMEGFSLALAARQRQIAFLEIRTVSNRAGVRDKGKWCIKTALNNLESILPTLLGAGK